MYYLFVELPFFKGSKATKVLGFKVNYFILLDFGFTPLSSKRGKFIVNTGSNFE